MTAVTRFEDLIAWQEARKLMQLAYRVTSEGSFAKDFEMRDQCSAVEVQSLCYAALDVKHITQSVFQECYEQAKKTKAIIGGLKQSALKNPRRPNKPSPTS